MEYVQEDGSNQSLGEEEDNKQFLSTFDFIKCKILFTNYFLKRIYIILF